MPPYDAAFPIGTRVRIADRARLEQFVLTWKYHHKLEPWQIVLAGQIVVVDRIGYYHGGDVLYSLHDAPGIWHECCLEPIPEEHYPQQEDESVGTLLRDDPPPRTWIGRLMRRIVRG